GALLFARSFRNLVTADRGFDGSGMVLADMDLGPLDLPKERRAAFKRDLLEAIRSAPGVTAAASMQIVPISGSGWADRVRVDGREAVDRVFLNRVSPGYYAAMGIPLLAGRMFDGRDVPGAPNAAIVNQTFARQLTAGENPVGKRFSIEASLGGRVIEYEIV